MLEDVFQKELDLLREQGLLRDLRILPAGEEGTRASGKGPLNFSSNDYLGLARDRRLKDAAVEAVVNCGAGATASRLLAGNLKLDEELEADLARMMGTETALVFGSGFLTNLGVLSSIAGPGDQIFSDWLNHASIIDGIRLSRAHCTRYRHRDLDHLESLLKKRSTTGKTIIVSESLFSMDGDVAPVAGLAELAARYGALFVVDEAHAIGVMGQDGGGVCRIRGNDVRPDITIGTLSKALGGYGGFVACSRTVRRFLINKARTFIYSTGLAPACLGSARAAVSIVMAHPELGQKLLAKTRRFKRLLAECGLQTGESQTQILPIIIGGNEKTVYFSDLLMERGLVVMPIRPPTVPVGTARVRLSVTLSMPDAALRDAAAIMGECARKAGILP